MHESFESIEEINARGESIFSAENALEIFLQTMLPIVEKKLAEKSPRGDLEGGGADTEE